jgi:hypothetical protein
VAIPEGSKNYLPVGKTICIVDMVDCRLFKEEDLKAACMEGLGLYVVEGKNGYAWILENPREIKPVSVKGIVVPWPWKGEEPILYPGWHKNHKFIFPKEKLIDPAPEPRLSGGQSRLRWEDIYAV